MGASSPSLRRSLLGEFTAPGGRPASWGPQADRGLSALRHWPRQRIHHSRKTYDFPDDFPQRLVRFKEESGLLWAELNRRPVPIPTP